MSAQGTVGRAVKASGSLGGAAPSWLDPRYWLARWQQSGGDQWDYKKAAHLLRRAGFGGKPEEIEAMVTLGMDRCVDLLITAPGAAIPDHGTVLLPNGEYLDLSLKEHQQGLWLYSMTTSPWLLQEKMALFWHDHFATGIQKVTVAENMGRQINLFRTMGLRGLRDLLVGVSRDPAMLYWLDNWLNTAANPQENYGREILELFSMGIDGGYTEQDVKAAARAFTGWTLQSEFSNAFVFNSSTHDYGPKQFLGANIQNPAPFGDRDGLDVIDRILQQKAPARFIAAKIVDYFVTKAPPPGVLDLLAAQFRQSGYDLRDLMSTLLRSNLFYAPQAVRTLIKSPMDHMVGAMRNLGITNVRYGGLSRQNNRGVPNGLGDRVFRMGFDLLNYGDPSGFDEGRPWINSLYTIERGNALMELTRIRNSEIAAVMDPMREINRLGLTTAKAIVDHYLKILVDDDVPGQARQNLYSYMVTQDSGPYVFNVTNPGSVDLKVRGVIHMIMLLPEYYMS